MKFSLGVFLGCFRISGLTWISFFDKKSNQNIKPHCYFSKKVIFRFCVFFFEAKTIIFEQVQTSKTLEISLARQNGVALIEVTYVSCHIYFYKNIKVWDIKNRLLFVWKITLVLKQAHLTFYSIIYWLPRFFRNFSAVDMKEIVWQE